MLLAIGLRKPVAEVPVEKVLLTAPGSAPVASQTIPRTVLREAEVRQPVGVR